MIEPTTVRPARLDDLTQIWPLARELATSFELLSGAFDRIFTALVDEPDVLLLVAEQADRLVGYLLAQQQQTFHANGPVVWVQEVPVTTDQRGPGVGRALMSAAETWSGEIGAAYVALATLRAGRRLLCCLGLSLVGCLLQAQPLTVSSHWWRRPPGRRAPR